MVGYEFFFAKEQVLYEYSVYKDKVFSPIIERIDKYMGRIFFL